jgi:amino-acid N-acetyltransferase
VAAQLVRAEARLGLGPGDPESERTRAGEGAAARTPIAPPPTPAGAPAPDGVTVRRAMMEDVPGIAAVMADYVARGVLLPRPVGELYQSLREFHVAVVPGAGGAPEIVGCAALRLLWSDLGEVRSLAVRPDQHGKGLGAALVRAVVDDARTLGLPRVIALTREVAFFERSGFVVASRDGLPRKVWVDCVRCPRRHACDEVAVVLDLVPGASEAAAAKAARTWFLPIPQIGELPAAALPIVS